MPGRFGAGNLTTALSYKRPLISIHMTIRAAATSGRRAAANHAVQAIGVARNSQSQKISRMTLHRRADVMDHCQGQQATGLSRILAAPRRMAQRWLALTSERSGMACGMLSRIAEYPYESQASVTRIERLKASSA
ncbi:hypothetical protein GCM10011320_46760 [Neoroseomonas lacus]|uniref:Uncharacterized protein n=2 Tax=Neoroseomonas lacus TaxID=287609 RepID=A0A917NVK7_9PROT|nr:hypothetical protein GCM10011320_46760 [Neoroseomonas lacus]